MTDTTEGTSARVELPCNECDGMVHALPHLLEDPGFSETVVCDDCWFHQFGDMLTSAELRMLDLHDPRDRAERDRYLTEYQRAGIADDQDPSLIELTVAAPAEIDGDIVERLIHVVEDAFRLRRSSPDDFGVTS